MNLSVATSPTESTLVTLPTGPTATREATDLGDLDAAASPFDELFPDLGALATVQQAASIGPKHLPVTSKASAMWVGSLMLRTNITQDSGALVGGEQTQGRGLGGGGTPQHSEDESTTENEPGARCSGDVKTVGNSGVSVLRRPDEIESSPCLLPSVVSVQALSDLPALQILPNPVTVAEEVGDLLTEGVVDADFSASSDLIDDSDKSVVVSGQRPIVVCAASPTVGGVSESVASLNDPRISSRQVRDSTPLTRGSSPRRSLSTPRDTVITAALGKKARSEAALVLGEVDSPVAAVRSTEIDLVQRPFWSGFVPTEVDGDRVSLIGKETEPFIPAGLCRTTDTNFDVKIVSAEVWAASGKGVVSSAEINQRSAAGASQSSGSARREKFTIQSRGEASRVDAPKEEAPIEYSSIVSDRTENLIPVSQAGMAVVTAGSTVQEVDVSAEPISREFCARPKQPVLAEAFAHVMSHRNSFPSSLPTELSEESINTSSPSSDSPRAADQAPTGSMKVGNAVLGAGAASLVQLTPAAGIAPKSALTDRLAATIERGIPDGFETLQSLVSPAGIALNIERANITGQAVLESTSLAPIVVPNETVVSSMRSVLPWLRSEKMPTPRGAKIAAAADVSRIGGNGGVLDSIKTFLEPIEQSVTSEITSVGTSVAESAAVMPAVAIPTHPIASNASDRASLWNEALSPALERTGTVDTTMFSTESTDSAHRAVEAVLTAAERVASGGRQSVDLHFSVGGADLNVRVEMRADQVHATFRTDSAELRSALANEWQSVNAAGNGESSLRLAPPVFTTNANLSNLNNASAFAGGDGSSRQRDSRANQSQDGSFELGASGSSRRAHFARTTSSSDSILPASSGVERTVSPTLARRLQTHA